MFKVGQKVVVIASLCKDKSMRIPKQNEVVKISHVLGFCHCGCGLFQYVIDGFERCYEGYEQCFVSDCLRAVDETFAEEVLENIKEQIKEEELIHV